MTRYEYLSPAEVYQYAASNLVQIKGARAGRAYWVNAHVPGEADRAATQANGAMYAFSLKTVTDVIPSPNRNAYALVFEDGSMEDLCSYDTVCVATQD